MPGGVLALLRRSSRALPTSARRALTFSLPPCTTSLAVTPPRQVRIATLTVPAARYFDNKVSRSSTLSVYLSPSLSLSLEHHRSYQGLNAFSRR